MIILFSYQARTLSLGLFISRMPFQSMGLGVLIGVLVLVGLLDGKSLRVLSVVDQWVPKRRKQRNTKVFDILKTFSERESSFNSKSGGEGAVRVQPCQVAHEGVCRCCGPVSSFRGQRSDVLFKRRYTQVRAELLVSNKSGSSGCQS